MRQEIVENLSVALQKPIEIERVVYIMVEIRKLIDRFKKEHKKFKDVKEDYTVIQSRGSTYTVLLNWRGQHLSVQIFFPKSSRPTKDEVVFEIRKIYPNAIVFSYAPSIKDPTKPLLFTGI